MYGCSKQNALANIGQNHKLILSLRNAPDKIQGGGIIPKLSAMISFALADCVTFQTQDARNYYPTFIQKKGCVILNPLQSNLPEYDVTKTKNAFISFCRLEPQKNLSMAIKAFAKFYKNHPEYELSLIHISSCSRSSMQSESHSFPKSYYHT